MPECSAARLQPPAGMTSLQVCHSEARQHTSWLGELPSLRAGCVRLHNKDSWDPRYKEGPYLCVTVVSGADGDALAVASSLSSGCAGAAASHDPTATASLPCRAQITTSWLKEFSWHTIIPSGESECLHMTDIRYRRTCMLQGWQQSQQSKLQASRYVLGQGTM